MRLAWLSARRRNAPVKNGVSTPAVKPKTVGKGRGFKAQVSVTTTTGAVAGTVEIYRGAKLFGAGVLAANGEVTVTISKKKARKLKVGKNTLTAKYLGSASVNAGQVDFVVKVKVKKHRH